MYPPRRAHKKSKNGCRQCKIRRVKCDEKIPCGRCVKRQSYCSLTVGPPPLPGDNDDDYADDHVAGGPSEDVRRRVGEDDPVTGGASAASASASASSTQQQQQRQRQRQLRQISNRPEAGTFSAADFALYNHWMQSTSLVVANEPVETSVWRTTIPLIAPHHPHLLHEICAVAAIHLSQLTPNDRGESSAYAKVAAEHQARALSLFRSALAEASPANAAAVFSTSALMVLYYFVAAKDAATLLFSEDPPGPPVWMHPIRGCLTILRQLEQSLRSGPLGDMLREHSHRDFSAEEVAASASDGRVLAMRDGLSEEDRALFAEDIEQLRVSFAVSDLGDQMSCKQGMLRQPTTCTETFTRALGEKRQAALVMMAFWLVLQARVRRGWLRGPCSPKDIMDVVVRHCTPESLALIEWPVQEVARLEAL